MKKKDKNPVKKVAITTQDGFEIILNNAPKFLLGLTGAYLIAIALS